MSSALPIAWAMTRPPISPRAWHAWPGERPIARQLAAPDDQRLEQSLGWPPGTLAVLHEAFGLKLDRYTGWEEAPGGSTALSPVAAAAAVYKRGVGFRRPGEAYREEEQRGSYQVEIRTNAHPPPLSGQGHLLVVDGQVARLWPQVFAPGSAALLTLDEHTKTLASVATLLEAWQQAGRPRAWVIVGGGLLGDVAGFAAALAGCAMTLVPTTLLAMADACVGGKTGVNFPPFGKNQLGLFHFPEAVITWTGWLATLPDRELRAGGAECLKHAFLLGDLGLAERLAQALATRDLTALEPLMGQLIGLKAAVVAEDPAETGKRAILNLGHTLAHALETYSQERTSGEATLLHGEAVALGLIYALFLSERVGSLSPHDGSLLRRFLGDAGCVPSRAALRRSLGGADPADPAVFARLLTLIGHDKKSAGQSGASSRWILLDAPGRVARAGNEWTVPVPTDALYPVLGDLLHALPLG